MRVSGRAWLIALAAVSLVIAVIIFFGSGPGARLWWVLGVEAVFVLFWMLVGRRAHGAGGPLTVVTIVATIATAGVLTAIHPVGALFQFFVGPVLWTLAPSVTVAVTTTVIGGLTVAGGFLFSLGTAPSALLQIATTQLVSMGFGLLMGLWITRVERMSAERKRLLDELVDAQAQLEVLHRDTGATAERERLAREVHDTIAQSLTGLVLLGQRARRDFAHGDLVDDTLELIESGARDALVEARALVASSAPVGLGDGLAGAVQTLAARFERESGIAVAVELEIDHPLQRETEVVLLRCAQEGLANIRKHSGATRASITITATPDHAEVRVTDDGRGYDPAAGTQGFGIAGLRDRLSLVGGALDLDGRPGAATLTARIPLGAAS